MKSFCPRYFGLLGTALLLAAPACQRPEEPPRPANLLSHEQMVGVLADLQQLEARVESSNLVPDSARALYLEQQKAILWQHEVTDSSFQRSYRYYGIHGRDLNDIYGLVIDTLSERAKKFAPHPPAPPTPPHQ